MNPKRITATLAGFGFLALCLSQPVSVHAQPTRADAEKDPLLKAMLAELDRSAAQLQLKGFEKPFFIEYRIEDVDNFQTKAAYGASEGSQHNRQRVARVTVRVGDYKSDSSGGRGDGSLQLTALDDDPIAVRSALWSATDTAYKNALAIYAQKQAALKQVQTAPTTDDFSHEKPLVSLADPMRLKLDEPAWVDRVAQASGLYRTDPSAKAMEREIEVSSAEFNARATTTYLVNTEGAIVRKAQAEYQESFQVGTQAPDGMRLERSHGSAGNRIADLESPDEFAKHVLKLIASLADLRHAPLVEEEYHGPVLLSADTSADVMWNLLGGAVTATRPKMGTEARTNGPFASSYHTRVLPESLDVVDDPGLKTMNGKGLMGAYDVDDQGVPAQAVKLIVAGRLENYLVGREPVRDIPQSNGHGRAGIAGPASPAIGVLKVTAKDGLTEDELNRKLLDLAKDRGLKSVYFVETLGGKMEPRLLYRIGADGPTAGKRELVRGAELADLDQRSLRSSVEAAGKELYVANHFGEVPETVIAPALLLDDVTIRRANEKNDKLPFYPPPQ